MKKIYVSALLPIGLCASLMAQAQMIVAITSENSVSATPMQSNGVGYELRNNDGTNFVNNNNCQYKWQAHYGWFPAQSNSYLNGYISTFNTGTVPSVAITWENAQNFCVNPQPACTSYIAQGYITVQLVVPPGGLQTCSSTIYSKDVPIKYLGPVGVVSANGNPIANNTTYALSCGTQTLTLSVPPAEGATQYEWALLPPSWIGDRFTSTPSATFQIDGSSGSNDFRVFARRQDVPNLYKGSPFTSIERRITDDIQVTGANPICPGTDRTYQIANLPGGNSVTWNVTGSASLVSSTNNSATVSTTYSGTALIKASILDACNVTTERGNRVNTGTALHNNIYFDSQLNNGPTGATNGSTHSISVGSTNSIGETYSIGWTNNYGDINAYLSGVNGGNAQLYVTGTYGNGKIDINSSNTCGTYYTGYTLYLQSGYRIASNPSSDYFTVEFDDTSMEESLPEEVMVLSEATSKVVRSVKINSVYDDKGFKESKKLTFDIKDLPRGTYYLKTFYPRETSDKKEQTTRLVFN